MSTEYNIIVKRLVLVDSAGFAYSEIPLDEHAILLGSGNVGKSSILNSLRLFLLPEENFKRSDSKFGFRNPGKNEYYKNEESFHHYFPSARSFIILETENPAGTHCQILYRGDAQGLVYKRIFVPVPYSELRETFWDTNDEDGIGFAQADLSVSKITTVCKGLSSRTQLVNDKRQIASLIYANDLLNKERSMMFSVLPMDETGPQKIESLRTLIKMLFEVGNDSKAMANAVANIVESKKNYERDHLDFNISDFLSAREKLDSDEKTINLIKSAKPAYASLGANFEEYKPQALSEEFNLWSKSVNAALINANNAVGKLQGEYNRIETRRKELANQRKRLDDAFKTESGQIKLLEKQKVRTEKAIEDGKKLISDNFGQEISDIQFAVEEERAEKLRDIKNLEESHDRAKRRELVTREIEQLDHRIAILTSRLENSQMELSNQLGSHPSLVLNSLSTKLLKANPDRELTSDEIKSISGFADLFEHDEESKLIHFFGTEIPENRIPDRSIEDEIKGKEIERRKACDEKRMLEDAEADPEKRAKEIRRKNQEIKEYDKDLKIIKDYAGAENRLDEINNDLKEITESFQETTLKLDDINSEIEGVQGKCDEMKSKLEGEKHNAENFNKWKRDLDKVSDIQKKFVISDRKLSAKEMIPAEDITETGVARIERSFHTLQATRDNILEGLRYFFEKGILDETHKEMVYERPSHENIKNAWTNLQDVYNNLDHRISTLEDQRRSHNELVEMYRTSLRKNLDHIHNVQNELNRKLESVSINDLAEIRVHIECDPAFEALVKESEGINLYTTENLSDAFYDKLRVFMSKFYDVDEDGNAENRLTMDRVIKKISYETRKINQKHFDDKAQSNSTTSLINLALVQNLMKGLLSDHYQYSLPAVLDEVANVDISQIRSLLNRIRSEGFRLFGAATHSASGGLVLEIGRHFKLDEMKTAKPFNEERTNVYWGGAEGVAEKGLEGWVSDEQKALMATSEGKANVR